MRATKQAALHRLLQSIAWHGDVFVIYRHGKNVYEEKNEEPEKVAKINALFHNGFSQHVELITSDAGITIDKNTPYLMTAWGNVEKLQLEDFTKINNRTFKISGITNIGEFNIIGEISLEEVI